MQEEEVSNPNPNRIRNGKFFCHCWKWLNMAARRNGGPTPSSAYRVMTGV